ncbi:MULTISPECIES: DUF3916 domain-containing protein [Exiguobacterium]|uniref:DUF3916 domain-containing protein n=1 Tax=Exiguobacterium TaxID=33986 RepID=UPI001BECA3C0|nr:MULTISPECIES: DUF3916 domain-containing protein [Exiguobacterium]MCT4776465.1 DUF3916 domain-containing protein [Exiguobacterium aquaticum]MCT4788285.1 DUF3916 domain-containing protein [Exiguobacterium mexicanum]
MNREQKIRGLRRKLRKMAEHVEETTSTFSTTFINGYWNSKIPIGQPILFSKRFKMRGKRLVVDTLLDGAIRLKHLLPDKSYQIVVLLDIPTLWSSEIIVFQSDEAYRAFLLNQNWTLGLMEFKEHENLLRQLSGNMELKRYVSVLCDEDGQFESESWLLLVQ